MAKTDTLPVLFRRLAFSRSPRSAQPPPKQNAELAAAFSGIGNVGVQILIDGP